MIETNVVVEEVLVVRAANQNAELQALVRVAEGRLVVLVEQDRPHPILPPRGREMEEIRVEMMFEIL